jgi:autotransporter-associated beta strand protein
MYITHHRTVFLILCAVLAVSFVPVAFGQNATTYYLDVNGTTPGFGNPDGDTIDWTATDWTTDPTGVATPEALPNWYTGGNFYPSQLVFGHLGTSGISNSTFTVTANGPLIAGVIFNAPCSVNLATFNVFDFLAPETWSVPAGSTFSIAQENANWAFTTVTMYGGGIINFNCNDVGRNAQQFIQSMTNGTVNLTDAYVDNSVAQASYELLAGTLNFATANSASAIGGVAPAGAQIFNLAGGTVNNTSGSALTLNLANVSFQIGGSFAFAGSSSLDFGGNAVNLGTVTPTITVSNNTLEFDGPLTNNAGLTVSGAGTLMLTGANTYSGNTTINGGALALSGSGSIANSPQITIAAGATFDVSRLITAATLGSGKTLQVGGSTSSATLATAAGKGLTLGSTASLQFTSFKPMGSGGAVPLTLSGGGTLTLGANTPVTITVANGGTALTAAGSPYKLIAKRASGMVATLPGGSLTVNGDGNNGTASLSISNGELYLVVSGLSVPSSTLLVLSSGSPVYGNNNLTFTATVTTNGVMASNATGTFVFSVDGVIEATNALSGGSANLNTGGLAIGSHMINARYSGDANYNSSIYTLMQTVSALPVVLTGARAYDGTSNANYSILTIANIVSGDNVYPASGSVGLAGSTPGEQAITSPNTLTLGGAQAANYAVTGLTGSVLITNGTSLLLTSSSQTNAYQIPVAFGATVVANGSAVDATGNVTFLTNGVVFCISNLVNGTTRTPYVSSLPVGINLITAQYSGDGNYSGSTNTLKQVVMQQTSNITFSNSLVAITFNPSATITTIIRKDTGENKNYDSQGFYIWNEQTGTKTAFASMVEIASNVVLFSTADGHYNVSFQVTCQNRYLKFTLLNVSDCPSGGIDTNWIGYSVAFQCYPFPYNGQINDGWQIYALGLDPMEDILSTVNPANALWPYVQYSQPNAYAYPYNKPNSQTASNFPLQPMGSLAIFTANSAAQHDDILYDIWAGESSLPEPNRANLANGWNRAAAQAWVTRWESELPPTKLLYLVPNDLPDLYNAADIMYANGLNGLYIFDYYWKGQTAVDSINTNLFPNGLSDVTAFEQYCAARGISLYFHWSSVFVNYADPLYGAMSPTGVSPDLARWATGTLLTGINSSSTSFNVQPEAGCQLMVAPPPWGNYDLGSAVPLSDSYPPYYPAWFTSIMNISNDLMFASATAVNPTNWLVSGVNRSSPTQVSQFGGSWGESHAPGSRVDFLLSEGGSFVPDSRSVLFTNLAVRYATLMNEENIAEADYDSLEQNQDLGNWGPRRESQALFETLDHPVHANSSFGSAPWGHFEYNFDSVQQQDGGPGYRLENAPAAEVRLWDPSLMATHLDEDQFSFGVQASYCPNLAIGGYHVGTTVNTITNQGWWSQVVANLNLWQSLAPYLTTNEQITLRSFGPDFYVPSQSGNGWELTPTRAMLRDGIDTSWQLMTESGPISPHQFMQVGDTLNSLANPYTAQTPQIEMLVLPSMTATNPNNVSLLPSGTVTFSTTAPYNWNLSPVNMSQARGLAITLTGDGSGSDLVLNIGGRYYVVTVNFTGKKTIEIPNGEVEMYRSSATGYSWVNSGQIGTFNYSAVGSFSLFLGYVPSGVTPNIQVSSITTMQENQTIGLVNPTLTLNGNNATITGTIPYNDYVVYSGGNTASVYDANWNFLITLPAGGATLTAVNGLNSFSVSTPSSPNTWMATRVKVSGVPWVFSKPTPIHEWRFENNANDTAGTANGTTINGPVYVPGIQGIAALAFNGTSQYVNIPNVPDMQFTSTQSFTISAWVKLNSLPNTETTIFAKDSAVGTWYGLGITAANQWVFSGATNVISPAAADIGQWHLITGVQDGTAGTRKLYVDGQLVAAGTAQDGSGTGATRIAALPGATPTQFLNGTIDDVRIYNQALAQTDISLLATNLALVANSIITGSVTAGQLVLNWPANQLWQLQAQTNSLGIGLSTNWLNVAGAMPPYIVNIVPTQPTVFYRLVRP